MLTASQRELAERLFAEAVAVARDEQADYVSANCGDEEVRREVESLLAFASRPAGIAEAIEHAAAGLAAPDFAGLRVGAYRLTGRIGQGGMGAVYRAVRDDDQFQKTVAIKMLRFPDGDPALGTVPARTPDSGCIGASPHRAFVGWYHLHHASTAS